MLVIPVDTVEEVINDMRCCGETDLRSLIGMFECHEDSFETEHVYTLEDFRDDYDHGVIGVYSSFEKAKEGLISVLKESIVSYENELNAGEDDEYAEELRGYIAELKENIEEVERVESSSYYGCGELFITEHTIE